MGARGEEICPWCRGPIAAQPKRECAACGVAHHSECVAEFGPCAIAECRAHSRPGPRVSPADACWLSFFVAHAKSLSRWEAFALSHAENSALIARDLLCNGELRSAPTLDVPPPPRLRASARYGCCYAYEKQGSCSGHVECCALRDETGSCSGHEGVSFEREEPSSRRRAWEAWLAYDSEAAAALLEGLATLERCLQEAKQA